MKKAVRAVLNIVTPEAVVEGAGVRLKRSIGTRSLDHLDPFLLLDHFDSRYPEDYQAGFPLHPHRGIETVTYVLAGRVAHRDTLGNSGTIGAGDVQWMTAGGGIMHEEMPQVSPEGISGFQLWVNLPGNMKMTRPRYQNISADEIPEVTTDTGAKIRVIAGHVNGTSGPVQGIAADPTYMDVSIAPGGSFVHPVPQGHAAFAYVFEGEGRFASGRVIDQPRLVLFGAGENVEMTTAESPVRFLFVSGKPLNEPIARYGPFVMNTRKEIEQALEDLKRGTFVK
jgi:redox-sensitive bicupin YhaK (pirin superfamily)